MTTAPAKTRFFQKHVTFGFTPEILIVTAIMLLSLGLHLYNIGSIGDANAYYTAAVKSMLGSWSNFFFVAAEPGGSVTVDKPPLGLWIEAVFAYFLGVSGFSVSLPNILAGVFSIPLLYIMVKKHAGELAGMIAAFVMVFTPVFVATNRHNTMDGILIFVLLLAAGAFIKAAASGKLRWVLLGTCIVGLGFNIKMMQAFLPLPAFYALYLFGSNEGWRRKTINLGIATILLISVSLSWATVVDLTPPDSRPYIGSSDNNTAMGLIFGYNGLSRLENTRSLNEDVPQNRESGSTQFSRETGDPGVFRFFTDPLSKQMSWLLPFALISVLLAAVGSRIRLPFESDIQKSLILWGGWLLTCVVFFSMVSGIFHAYYAIMLAPPLGAMVGIGFVQLWEWGKEKRWANISMVVSALVTLGFQIFAAYQYEEWLPWLPIAGITFAGGSILMVVRKRAAYVMILLAMLIIPSYWTVMTAAADPNINLPTAYAGGDQQASIRGKSDFPNSAIDEEMLAYLEANTVNMKYLVAVPSSQQGSQLVLATGRPVLFIGGFTGLDEVVTAEDLSAIVAKGDLRYILYGDNRSGSEDISAWLKSSCAVMLDYSEMHSSDGPGNQPPTLYMCR